MNENLMIRVMDMVMVILKFKFILIKLFFHLYVNIRIYIIYKD